MRLDVFVRLLRHQYPCLQIATAHLNSPTTKKIQQLRSSGIDRHLLQNEPPPQPMRMHAEFMLDGADPEFAMLIRVRRPRAKACNSILSDLLGCCPRGMCLRSPAAIAARVDSVGGIVSRTSSTGSNPPYCTSVYPLSLRWFDDHSTRCRPGTTMAPSVTRACSNRETFRLWPDETSICRPV